MSTEEIIWTIVIIVAVLALIGFAVMAMRKKSRHANETRAAELREEAQQRAAVLPDAHVRAKESEAQAERARLEAERAEERARTAQAEFTQQQALHEEQIREADRLDPTVDHKSRDYAPETASLTDTHSGDHTGTGTTGTHTSGTHTSGQYAEGTDRSSTSDPDTIFDGRHSDTSADTSRTEPTHADPDRIDPDQRDGSDGGPAGGSHRA